MSAASASRESYDPAFFEALFKAEEKHFWFCARNKIIGAFVRQIIASFPSGYRVLEIGCGTGNVLRVLEAECAQDSVTGMDLFEEGLRLARQRTRCQLIAGDVHQVKFDSPFSLIGMFDVLEHLDDDDRILTDVHRLLVPGGVLLLTVPAHMSLWSYFDVAACHCRRYSLRELSDKLSLAGFQIDFVSEFMMALFPLVWLTRRLRPTKPGAGSNLARATDELKIIPVLNGFLTWLLSIEARWLARRRRLPFGTSLLALARKPAAQNVSGLSTIVSPTAHTA